MVGASDVDSNFAYSSSSSSSNEDCDRCKNKKSSKNLSGLSYYTRDGFCDMAHSSAARRVTRVTQTPTLRTPISALFPGVSGVSGEKVRRKGPE
jgi:hypothetical protein